MPAVFLNGELKMENGEWKMGWRLLKLRAKSWLTPATLNFKH
jgi:hypothetical protein